MILGVRKTYQNHASPPTRRRLQRLHGIEPDSLLMLAMELIGNPSQKTHISRLNTSQRERQCAIARRRPLPDNDAELQRINPITGNLQI